MSISISKVISSPKNYNNKKPTQEFKSVISQKYSFYKGIPDMWSLDHMIVLIALLALTEKRCIYTFINLGGQRKGVIEDRSPPQRIVVPVWCLHEAPAQG